MSYPSTALPLHSNDLSHPKTCRNIELHMLGQNLKCSTNCEQLEVQPPSVHCGATPWCCIAPYHAFHSVFVWPQLEPLFGTLGTCLGPPLLKPFNLLYIKTNLYQCISMYVWMFNVFQSSSCWDVNPFWAQHLRLLCWLCAAHAPATAAAAARTQWDGSKSWEVV